MDMPRQPHSRERICDALESCRPGSNDLQSAEFADVAEQIAQHPHLEAVFARIQSADSKIAAAFQDVAIPVGLQQRLVAAINLAQTEDEFSTALHAATESDADNAPTAGPSVASQKDRKLSRRWLILSSGLLTSTVAILLAIFFGMNNSGGYTKETVQDEAIRFFNNDNPTTPGQLLTESSYPKGFPLSNAIRYSSKIHWRPLVNFLDKPAVAYDLPSQKGSVATLYVVDRTVANLGDYPVGTPSNTAGCCVAAWQENELLYVLVVKGSQKSYEEYLAPRGQMAFLDSFPRFRVGKVLTNV
jgi:hypothetical protein